MNNYRKRILQTLVGLICAFFVAACAFLQHPKFGTTPEGDGVKMMEKSLNYKNGEFHNQIPTPMFTDDSSFVSVLVSNLMHGTERLKPDTPIPSVKTDLKSLDRSTDVVVWFGHSSYYIQLGGKRILIDPVFSPYASPLPVFNRA